MTLPARTSSPAAGRWAVRPAVLLLAVSVAYIVTLSRTPTGDSLIDALAIERGQLGDLLIPHRLLARPIGWLVSQGWTTLGWRDGPLLPLQVLNALGGAAAATLVYAIGRRLVGATGPALLAAAGFAVSAATWSFATDAEPALTPLALALAPIWGLLAAGPAPSRRQTVLLGLAVGLAVLTYMAWAGLVPVLAVGLLLAGGLGRRERWQRTGLLVGVVAIIVLPLYLLMMVTVLGVRDVQALRGWQLYGGLSGDAAPYGQLKWTNLPYGAYGFLRSLVWYPPIGMNESTAAHLAAATTGQQVAFAAYLGIGLAVVAMPPLTAAVRRRTLRFDHQAGGMLVVWGLLNALFAVWWVPGDLQFWIPVLVAWWLLVAVLIAPPRRADSDAAAPRRSRLGLARSVVAGGVLVVALVNGLGLIAPSMTAEDDRRHQVLAGVRAVAGAGDIVITSGLDGLPLYLTYFTRHPTINIYDRLMAAQGRDPDPLLAGIDRELAAARAAGRRAFVVGVRPIELQAATADDAGRAAQEAIRRQQLWPTGHDERTARLTLAYLSRLRTRPAWQRDGEAILEVLPG